tara:strand:- start:2766 stop:4601 length:1836 start_codon:yes stop_codon:yes gene_type:complete
MNIVTLDFETFYSKEFGFSKLTTEEYVRDARFETIGVSVKVDGGPTKWCSGTKSKIKKFLDQFEWINAVAVAHNAKFDMAILNWHFGIRPKRIADTLSMARAAHGTEVGGSLAALATHYELGVKGTEVVNALGKRRVDFSKEELARYGEYCCNDTELTYKLFRVLAQGFPLNELKLIDLTIRMFTEPVLELDVSALRIHLSAVQHYKNSLLSSTGITKEELMSNPKFALLLQQYGITPPKKISPTTGKETYAFAKSDQEFMALQEHPHLQVQALMAARLGLRSTLEETRTERFISVASRGELPIPLKYYAAHTGRWGGDDKLNLQNLPRAAELKNCIMAPQGHVIIDSDSSQIEARTLAWLSGQEDLVEAFERGKDVYKIMASSIYGKPQEEIVKQERFVGKTTILGCGYGMGAERFRDQLANFGVTGLTAGECQRIIDIYRATYSYIPTLWRQAQDFVLPAILGNQTAEFGRAGVLAVEGEKGIRLPNGLYLNYPNLRWVEMEPGERPQYVYDQKRGRAVIPTKIYGGKVVENVCQALARIVIGEQMLVIAKKYKVAMTVHDAITCVVPEEEAENGKEFIELCMRLHPTWALGLPLNCEAGTGQSYGGCK